MEPKLRLSLRPYLFQGLHIEEPIALRLLDRGRKRPSRRLAENLVEAMYMYSRYEVKRNLKEAAIEFSQLPLRYRMYQLESVIKTLIRTDGLAVVAVRLAEGFVREIGELDEEDNRDQLFALQALTAESLWKANRPKKALRATRIALASSERDSQGVFALAKSIVAAGERGMLSPDDIPSAMDVWGSLSARVEFYDEKIEILDRLTSVICRGLDDERAADPV